FEQNENLNSYLAKVCNGIPEKISAFVEQTLKVIGAKLDKDEPFNPTWAVLWNDLEMSLDNPPEQWLEVLGVPKQESGRWLVALRYTVGEAGTLARPTLLDAGWNAYHFPSPPQAPPRYGGHPMNLGDHVQAKRLPWEYVHSQISFNIAHWVAGGRRIGRTSRV